MINSTINVSVIILNYNTFNETCNCIKSIQEYTSNITIEIILIDNASEECNPDLFKELFPEIILIKSKVNLGFSKGCNKGIENANGQYILLLNSDTLFFDNSILAAYQYYKTLDNPGVLTIKLLNLDQTVQYNCGRFPKISNSLFELFRIQKIFKKFGSRYLLGSFFNYKENVEVDWVWGTFFFFEKKNLSSFKSQRLNDDFFMYCEDLLWCYEFKLKKYKNYYLADTAIFHLHKGDGTNLKNEHAIINYNIFYRKYYNLLQRACIDFVKNLTLASSLSCKSYNSKNL
jgi:GT2 family glycosyltransferase